MNKLYIDNSCLNKIIQILEKNKRPIILLCLVIIIITIYYNIYYSYELFKKIDINAINKNIILGGNNKNNKSYYVRNNCLYTPPKTLSDIIKETIDKFKFNLYLPCSYDNYNLELQEFTYDPTGMYFMLTNSDLLVAKNTLGENIVEKYGRNNNIAPKQWNIFNDEEFDLFKNEYQQNNLYILKKNMQRQKDIQISNNLQDITNIVNKHKNDAFPYVVIQELLQNPYLIDGRKINLRVYILICKYKEDFRLYIYNDGFMYYTAERYEPNSTDIKTNITTGYIDREVYKKNPLTLKDLRKYLDSESRPLTIKEKHVKRYYLLSKYLFDNVQKLLKDVISIYRYKLGDNDKLKDNKQFELYGSDIAVFDDLTVKLMEINKGPDLDAKDERDSELKHNLVRDIFKSVNLIDDDDKNDFVRIYLD